MSRALQHATLVGDFACFAKTPASMHQDTELGGHRRSGGWGGGEKCGDACRMIETTCTWKHTANIAKCVNEWQQQKKSMAPNTDSSSRNEKDRRKARAA